jgi:uncharacterized protein YdiU (UPF0061 family)
MDEALAKFGTYYNATYQRLMVNRLGFAELPEAEAGELLQLTIKMLSETQVSYHDFFVELRKQFAHDWREDSRQIFSEVEPAATIEAWRQFYYHLLQTLSPADLDEMQSRLRRYNPLQSLLRPVIEEVWQAIAIDDNWQPFYELIRRIQEA